MLLNFAYFLFFTLLACGESEQKSSSSSELRQETHVNKVVPAYQARESKSTTAIDGSIIERHEQLGKTPADAIALWMEAAIRAQAKDEEGFKALEHLTLPLRENKQWRTHGSFIYFTRAIKEDRPSFRSFVVGATPQNGYKVDLENIKVSIAYEGPKNSYGRKFMLESSGSPNPRPIYLKESTKTGLFYVNEFSSMYVDVEAAVDPNKEEFK